ncbi:MAG: thiolase domain-containing protein [Thaumarchaeota archaeon]|nr:thiolase domain-containing protein [Nitrososphaerota archaeon]
MRSVSIIGIEMTNFGRLEKSFKEIAAEACVGAMQDAQVPPKQIEEFVLGNFSSGTLVQQETIAPAISNSIGLPRIPATKVEGACASGGIALRYGYQMVANGLRDFVLVAGLEKMTAVSTPKATETLIEAEDREIEGRTGLTFPGFFALVTNRYSQRFGTTREEIAQVSVKNRRYGAKNPKAQFRKEVTIDDVINSRLIADPLRLLDCCAISDGAAAAVLCPTEIARKFSKEPVEVIGISQVTGRGAAFEYEDLTGFDSTKLAAEQAMRMARVSTKDIDVLELHDCFTIAEIVASEDLGFFTKGTGAKALQEGQTEIGGKIPINPSGGLLSKGHPIGATGIGQVYEVVQQLRGSAENQVSDAEIGMAHNFGATGTVCVVSILKR